jgi:hypothetical protein
MVSLYIAQADFKLKILYLSLSRIGIIGMYHYARQDYLCFPKNLK